MSLLSMRIQNLFIILISLNLGIILADDDKCTSIEHCSKCPNNLTCEICETGYKLNYENKCIESNENSQNSTNDTNASVRNPGSSNQQSVDSNQNSTTSLNSENKNSNPSHASNNPVASNASHASNNPVVSNASHASNNPVTSNAPHASNNPVASNAPHASNNPVASNAPRASNAPIDSNKQSSTFAPSIFGNLTVVKVCIYIVIIVVFILCIRWIFLKKKKGKVGYFYDESGYPGEKAKVVYIQ
jgi:cobalamin biosynthesis Mg chelatase CobN